MKFPWKKTDPATDDTLVGLDQEHVSLARVGHSRIDDAVKSVRKTPWSLTILQLLWTAGPVTFLAMQGGYYLGFGHAAPAQNFVFFGAYTLLLGVIGILAKFASLLLHSRRQEDARQVLSESLDIIPDLLFAARDLALARLSPEARRLRAAGALLHEFDISPESVALAVRELSGDPRLARTVAQIETYRRVGLHSRVQDLIDASAEARAAALEKAHADAPEEADLLRDRLMGVAPSFEYGVSRRENFLGAIFAAADQHNLDLMVLEDVQELLALLFELLSGRNITHLLIDYEGEWQLERSLDEVEAARNRYSISQAMSLSRLQVLATYLADHPAFDIDESELNLAPEEMLTHLAAALERLVSLGHRDTTDKRTLRGILERVRQCRRTTEELQQQRKTYMRTLKRWEELRRRQAKSASRKQPKRRRERGLRIKEDVISLDDEQKIAVAQEIVNYLQELDFKVEETGEVKRAERPLTGDDLKRLAIRLALILQPYVQLTNASIQRAIYSSRAAYLGGLQPGFSADAKAGMGAAAVKEVREDLGRSAERLALRIVRVYRVPLNTSMIEFLVTNYQANRDRLETIAATPVDENMPPEHYTATLVGLSLDSGRWRHIIQSLEQVLRYYDRLPSLGINRARQRTY